MVVGELKLSLGLVEQRVTCNPCLGVYYFLSPKFLTDDDCFIGRLWIAGEVTCGLICLALYNKFTIL